MIFAAGSADYIIRGGKRDGIELTLSFICATIKKGSTDVLCELFAERDGIQKPADVRKQRKGLYQFVTWQMRLCFLSDVRDRLKRKNSLYEQTVWQGRRDYLESIKFHKKR